MVLFYKANGKKVIRPPAIEQETTEATHTIPLNEENNLHDNMSGSHVSNTISEGPSLLAV